jgi:hypothetical protein
MRIVAVVVGAVLFLGGAVLLADMYFSTSSGHLRTEFFLPALALLASGAAAVASARGAAAKAMVALTALAGLVLMAKPMVWPFEFSRGMPSSMTSDGHLHFLAGGAVILAVAVVLLRTSSRKVAAAA